jgi:hypothetical protein
MPGKRIGATEIGKVGNEYLGQALIKKLFVNITGSFWDTVESLF